MELTSKKQGSLKSQQLSVSPGQFVAFNDFSHTQHIQNRNTVVGDLAAYLEVPFIHKRLIITCVILSILAAWIAIRVWPRSYESEAKLVVRIGRESISLDPTTTTSSTLMLQKTQEEEIVSSLEMLNSRQVAETVVDTLTPQAILAGVLPGEPAKADESVFDRLVTTSLSALQSTLLAAGIKDELSDRALAVLKLQQSVMIHSPRRSTVIIVEAASKSPGMAQAIANEVTQAFLSLHLKTSRTEGSYPFFQQQSDEVERQLNDLVADRSLFMQEHKLVSIDANRELLKNRIDAIDRDLLLARGELEQSLSEIGDLLDKADVSEDEIVAAKVGGSDLTWSGMRQSVYELEVEEQRALVTYTSGHPALQRIQTQLNGVRDILEKLESERVDESKTPNPVKIALLQDIQQHQTRVVGLRSMISEKEKQRETMREEIDELLHLESTLTEIDRNIKLKDASLQRLREKLEEARIIDELDSKEISNVHVFQPATFVERAASPRKPLLAAGFLMLGLMTGFGLSFAKQAGASTVRTAMDIEISTGASVIASIPYLRKLETPHLKDQRIYRHHCEAILSDVLLSRPSLLRAKGGLSLGVIGLDVGAGASTLAVQLALMASQNCHMRTMLVDADPRQRSVSKRFGLNGSPGLLELVKGDASHDECVQRSSGVPLDLIASSAESSDDYFGCSADEIIQALEAFKHDCDLMIVDLPSASLPHQAIGVAQNLDCILVVFESEKTLASNADRLLGRLAENDAHLIGVVLNKTKSYLPGLLRRCITLQS